MIEVVLEGQALGPNSREDSLGVRLPSRLVGRVVGRTSIGVGRERNQDAASAYTCQIGGEKHLLLSVADGLGFYLHSEMSSFASIADENLIVEAMTSRFLSLGEERKMYILSLKGTNI